MLYRLSQLPESTRRSANTMGRTMNSPTASTTPNSVAIKEMNAIKSMCSFSLHHFSNLVGSPSSPYTAALRIKIFEPVTREETKLTTPRTTGIFATRFMPLDVFRRRLSIWMFPSGSLTAVAYAVLPRIMTPSSTACPPI